MNIYYLKKRERKKGRNRKRERGKTRVYIKMAQIGQEWLRVGVACSLKGPDQKNNTGPSLGLLLASLLLSCVRRSCSSGST